MKSRTRQHQAVDQSHCKANVNSLPQCAQHATGLRAMNEQFVADTRVTRGNHEWLAANREANVADASKSCAQFGEICSLNPRAGRIYVENNLRGQRQTSSAC